MSETPNRQNALLGALVADAATMGLHWMYDQDHISKLSETGELLFRQPDANIYEGQKAYFAHAAKKVGEFSQYGESARVVTEVISAHGSYQTDKHRQLFFDTFGPCGSYHGFADRPTKALVAKIITEGDDIPDASGADDDQLPALSAVPALFALNQNDVVAAVSVTSVNAQAISGAQVLYDCLSRVQQGAALPEALAQSAETTEPELLGLLQQALNLPEYNPLAAAEQFGLPCHIKQGMPVAWHLLKHAADFETVVRDNLRCGGDSCGRAMAVGALAGLAFGVPAHLQARVTGLP